MHDRSTGMAVIDDAAPGEGYLPESPLTCLIVQEMQDMTAVDQQRILRFAMALTGDRWPIDLAATRAMPLDQFRALCDQQPAPMVKAFFPCIESSAAIAGKTVRYLHGCGADMRYDTMDSDRFLAEIIDHAAGKEYMGPCARPELLALPVWDTLIGPVLLRDGSILYLDWDSAAELSLASEFDNFAMNCDDLELPFYGALDAFAKVQEYPERLFHVVDADGAGLKVDSYGSAEFIGAMAARGFRCIGPVHRARLRYELQGMPAFEGLYGPIYSRTGIRYETERAHGRIDS